VIGVAHILFRFLADLLRLIALSVRRGHSLKAENLFLRRQLALYKERGIKPRRIGAATRMSLVFLSTLFDWRDALI
jgi:putative transposase